MNRSQLAQTLRDAEGVRHTAYDDRTGITLKPGTMLLGTPTIGIGHNLLKPLSDTVIEFLLQEDINEAVTTLDRLCPWWTRLSDARQRALCEMAFQLGGTTLKDFHPTLSLLAVGDYHGAADHLRHSAWYGQCRSRVQRIAQTLESGLDPVSA